MLAKCYHSKNIYVVVHVNSFVAQLNSNCCANKLIVDMPKLEDLF